MAAIARLKLQAAAHVEETVSTVKTENNNLVFYFGDANPTQKPLLYSKTQRNKRITKSLELVIQQVISILSPMVESR